jgi:guanylate kinase
VTGSDPDPASPPRDAPRGLLVVVAGPSGVGKGTVHAELRRRLPDAVLSISATTREPRPGERDGVDYRFVDRDRFVAMTVAGELLEWAEYAGNLYGTPRDAALAEVAAGRVVLLDIEVQGAEQIKAAAPDALLVFLLPPSFAELERRLRARGTEDDAAVGRRLEVAREELSHADAFDVRVVNDEVDRAVDEVLVAIAAARSVGGTDPDVEAATTPPDDDTGDGGAGAATAVADGPPQER